VSMRTYGRALCIAMALLVIAIFIALAFEAK
jgi:hypothetical protein